MKKRIHPEYGMLGPIRIRKVFIEMQLGDKDIEGDLEELVNMFGRNQLGCQDRRCASG